MTARATPRIDRLTVRKLAELAESQAWVHHVADADTGEVLTTPPLDRPTAPLSRTERLSRLGHHFDPSIFGGPTYRLTPRSPYQTSPMAWVTFYEASITMPDGEDMVHWSLPRDLGDHDLPGLRARVEEPPQGRCLVSLTLTGYSWPDHVGHFRIEAFVSGPPPVSIRIPLDEGYYASHTFDLVVTTTPGLPLEVWMSLEPGVHVATFSSFSLGRPPLVLDPGVL